MALNALETSIAWAADLRHLNSLRHKQRSRKAWHAVIVGELRHSNDPTTQLRGSKLLRVVKGDAMDILSWMRAHIVGKVDKTVSRSIIG
jgi:hypothetical protein